MRRLIPGDEVVCVRTGKTHTVTGAFYDKGEPYYQLDNGTTLYWAHELRETTQ